MLHCRALLAICLFDLVLRASSQVRVISPKWVVEQFPETKGRIKGSTATFGAPFYGDRVLGRLIWAKSLNGQAYCKDDDYTVPAQEEIPEGSESGRPQLINIIMVRRGQCSFTNKVKIAYGKGAHAVIIVDQEDSPLTAKDLQQIIVADDGYGDKITIPSVLISKEEGARLIEAAGKTHVLIEMKWNIPQNKVVTMDLWMSSGARTSMKFMKEFASRRKALNEVVQFVPHYVVFSMPKTDPGVYQRLCSDTSGSYCTEDPDGSGDVTGKDVLEEDVRQLCIHSLTKVERNTYDDLKAGNTVVEYAAKYWDYIEKFGDDCPLDAPNPDDRFGKVCSEKLMKKVGLDVLAVNKCMLTTTDEKLKKEREHSAWSPRALRINGWRYSGMLDADLVTRAICAGFINQPAECEKLLAKRDPLAEFVAGLPPPSTGMSVGTFILTMSIMAAVLGAGFFVYKNMIKAELTTSVREQVYLEVQQQMAEYARMPADRGSGRF